MLGEWPHHKDVRAYIDRLWDGWPWAATMVWNCWRLAYNAKTTRYRHAARHGRPLYQPDRLIREHGLLPTAEVRLTAMAQQAVEALGRAAVNADGATYRERKRELIQTLAAFDELRSIRHPRSNGGSRSPTPIRRWQMMHQAR
jgi:hypothetical protein